MKLRLSCADFSFPLLDHDGALAAISLLGLRGADIGLFEGHGHLKPSRELLKPARNGASAETETGGARFESVRYFPAKSMRALRSSR